MRQQAVLTLSCPDTIGIAASVTQCIAEHHANIVCSNQHGEQSNNTFFMRVAFDIEQTHRAAFEKAFVQIADRFSMNWQLRDPKHQRRMIILASQQSHCVADLLYRYHSGDLPCEIMAVISNHPDLADYVAWHNIPYHHIEMSGDLKAPGFEKIASLIKAYQAEVIVLARFMQILPPDLSKKYFGQIINIHHSFLPAFVGANPYAKAFAKGVKLIGATCHYVTEDLDEGPIIEQDVVRIDHGHSSDDIKRLGKDVEKTVLARGVTLHLEDRVIIHGNKTVVF